MAAKMTQSEVPAFGEEIARLRTRRKWSRSKLSKQLAFALANNAVDCKDYGEGWLFRLESGQIVNVPRWLINALGAALECSDRERMRLLLLADRNILRDKGSAVTREMELFGELMLVLYEEAAQFLSIHIKNLPLDQLSDSERQEIELTALEFAIENFRSGGDLS